MYAFLDPSQRVIEAQPSGCSSLGTSLVVKQECPNEGVSGVACVGKSLKFGLTATANFGT